MATTRADERLDDAAAEAALEALVHHAEAGAPDWADVLERAAALPPCRCHDLDPQTSTSQEAAWPLPIRNRRTT
jgi:hypothetical protein